MCLNVCHEKSMESQKTLVTVALQDDGQQHTLLFGLTGKGFLHPR